LTICKHWKVDYDNLQFNTHEDFGDRKLCNVSILKERLEEKGENLDFEKMLSLFSCLQSLLPTLCDYLGKTWDSVVKVVVNKH
jgi:hypothetical protein